jgi:hypothetical protein
VYLLTIFKTLRGRGDQGYKLGQLGTKLINATFVYLEEKKDFCLLGKSKPSRSSQFLMKSFMRL